MSNRFLFIRFLFSSDSIKSSSSVTAPKSLREWHEQPVNLSEQPPLTERVNVQILSPNSDRVNKLNESLGFYKNFLFRQLLVSLLIMILQVLSLVMKNRNLKKL
jgi:hypothetical protein